MQLFIKFSLLIILFGLFTLLFDVFFLIPFNLLGLILRVICQGESWFLFCLFQAILCKSFFNFAILVKIQLIFPSKSLENQSLEVQIIAILPRLENQSTFCSKSWALVILFFNQVCFFSCMASRSLSLAFKFLFSLMSSFN